MTGFYGIKVGDEIVKELAFKAGANGVYEVRRVWQEVHENRGEDGEFALETWLHFVTEEGEGQEGHYYLPGSLQQRVLEVVYSELTVPFYYR